MTRTDSPRMPPMETALMALGAERFVSLTTFRKTGERVSTPVWIARDDHALVVTTPAGSGKVTRLRRDSRVELQPCGRTGRVEQTVAAVPGIAEIVTGDDARQRMTSVISAKYKLEYRVVMWIERLLVRQQRDRVILRITSPDVAHDRPGENSRRPINPHRSI